MTVRRSPAPLVMIIGDSFTVGSGPVERWDTYAAKAARELGWQLVTAGAAGTGFVNPGPARRTFQESFTEELSWRPAPDLLIVSGGHNDRRTGFGKVNKAARRLLELARTTWPHTRIIVIGPLWMAKPPRWAYGVRDAVAVAADTEGATFLDPLGEHWRRETILPDGVHPTLAGHVQVARWLVTALRGHGIGPAPGGPGPDRRSG
ncbi:SGNH/GDSL hydrolase family protein [Streptosporangium sp. NBC_01756]|uniref:SGNH/GDSL hydrolase family protein n=1 Tax=Streptosporangium sp. NBC_01756 TaxID=2975950 RepID=UPI002DD8DBEF|nr:SGNH/GDSL hydrolase family protein [Streptosporangium sp. NBC_01756]WSC83335.1 SGNH/GDSL hydrolase family protein [Streptosporangium sp. NBC_01756]